MGILTDRLKGLVLGLPEPLVKRLRRARALAVLRNFTEDEEPDLGVVKYLVRPGDTVLDIGANIGYYTRFLSERVGVAGCVYSVEPVPITFEILAAGIEKFDLTNVELHNCAVSDQEGRATMEVPSYETGGMNLYQARITTAGGKGSQAHFEVDVRTVDSLVAGVVESIAFVKVDVEGVEFACLKGARNMIARAHPAWLIEVNGDPDNPASEAHSIFGLMAGEGYTAFWYEGMKLRKRRPGDRSVNYFFLTERQVEDLGQHVEFA
jgi:FkbM family methyltransferase